MILDSGFRMLDLFFGMQTSGLLLISNFQFPISNIQYLASLADLNFGSGTAGI